MQKNKDVECFRILFVCCIEWKHRLIFFQTRTWSVPTYYLQSWLNFINLTSIWTSSPIFRLIALSIMQMKHYLWSLFQDEDVIRDEFVKEPDLDERPPSPFLIIADKMVSGPVILNVGGKK